MIRIHYLIIIYNIIFAELPIFFYDKKTRKIYDVIKIVEEETPTISNHFQQFIPKIFTAEEDLLNSKAEKFYCYYSDKTFGVLSQMEFYV